MAKPCLDCGATGRRVGVRRSGGPALRSRSFRGERRKRLPRPAHSVLQRLPGSAIGSNYRAVLGSSRCATVGGSPRRC